MISICLTLSMHKLKNMPTFTKKPPKFWTFLIPVSNRSLSHAHLPRYFFGGLSKLTV